MTSKWIFVTAVLALELTIGSGFSLMKQDNANKNSGKPTVIKNRFSIPEGFQEGSDSIVFPDSDAERFGRYKRGDRVKRQGPPFNGGNFGFNNGGGFPQGNNGFNNGRDFQPGNNGFNNGGDFQPGNNGFNGGGGFQPGTDNFERPRPPPLPTRRPVGGTTRTTPTTQAPFGGVTEAPDAPTSGTTIAGCKCPTTPEFNPVCGQDRVTYTNLSRVRCFNRCGYRVDVLHRGACITSTTPTPSTTWTSLISGRRRT